MSHLTGSLPGKVPGCGGFDGPVPSAAPDGQRFNIYSNITSVGQVTDRAGRAGPGRIVDCGTNTDGVLFGALPTRSWQEEQLPVHAMAVPRFSAVQGTYPRRDPMAKHKRDAAAGQADATGAPAAPLGKTKKKKQKKTSRGK
jgi:hypothetical protein